MIGKLSEAIPKLFIRLGIALPSSTPNLQLSVDTALHGGQATERCGQKYLGPGDIAIVVRYIDPSYSVAIGETARLALLHALGIDQLAGSFPNLILLRKTRSRLRVGLRRRARLAIG